jgi:flagellar basal-body rod protein FlgB
LKASADYSWARNEIISSNIANVDTPNYKRQDVSFESVLSTAVAKAGSSSYSLTQAVRNIDYRHVTPTVYTDNSNLSYRIDGNNVDIDTEQVELASEQIKYQALTTSITSEFQRLQTVLK